MEVTYKEMDIAAAALPIPSTSPLTRDAAWLLCKIKQVEMKVTGCPGVQPG